MIVIIGGGLAGLIIARELSVKGKDVTLLESRNKVGGLIAAEEVAGVKIDVGAESFARRSSETADYCHSLGLKTITPGGKSWIYNGQAFPIPQHSSLGIPGYPDAEDVTAIIGDPSRALEDLTMDPKIGQDATSLGELVEARMGKTVVDKLVTPIAGAIYSSDVYRLAVRPDLRAAFIENGSLAKAVRKMDSGPAVEATDHGMFQLVETLADQASAAGAKILTNAKATGLEKGAKAPTVIAEVDGVQQKFVADQVVLATDIRAGQKILSTFVELEPFEVPSGNPTLHVNLAIDSAELDDGPRGSGLLVAPGTSRAKALTHMSIKWPWLREVSKLHFIRVSYAQNEPVAVSQAIEDANQLLGTHITEAVDHRMLRWGHALTPHTPQLKAWTAKLPTIEGLRYAGSWVSGTGIAAVVAQARKLAEELS